VQYKLKSYVLWVTKLNYFIHIFFIIGVDSETHTTILP